MAVPPPPTMVPLLVMVSAKVLMMRMPMEMLTAPEIVPSLMIVVWKGRVALRTVVDQDAEAAPKMVAPVLLVIEPPPAAMPSLVLGRPSDPWPPAPVPWMRP